MVVKDVPSNPSRIGSNNSGISDSFVYLLIHLSHPLYELHVALVQGLVIDVNMVFMLF
jgi:hypothetical protein